MKDEAKVLAQSLADFVNGATKHDREAFVEELIFSTHRTLQQSVGRLLLELFIKYASLTDSQVDLRNEGMRDWAKQIVSKTTPRLPTI